MALTFQAISPSETALFHEGVRVISFGPSGVILSVVVSEIINNTGSFDCTTGQDFRCTPTGAFTLTFTNIPASPKVQKGTIILVNPNAYAIAAHANTKVGATLLASISAAGFGGTGSVFTTGICFTDSPNAGYQYSGDMTLTLQEVSSNTWVAKHTGVNNGSSQAGNLGSGKKSLAAILSTLRVTTVNGTDVGDAGSISVLVEG